MNTPDPRCCGSGVCIIDPEGRCWCGQQWDGERMRHVPLQKPAEAPGGATASPPSSAGDQTDRT